jgi:hypothetical protein
MSDVQLQFGNDPQDELDLKSERVQFELAPADNEDRLKSERVKERLRRMPGWAMSEGGHAIDRARYLPSPFGAADYASFVLREAARTRQRVQISLYGNRVVISVLAPFQGEGSGVIGRKQLDFAAGLV